MMFGLRERFDYFMCGACASLQIVTIPPDLGRFYPESYYSFQSPARRRGLRQWLRRTRDRYAVSSTGWLGRWLYARHPYPELRSLANVPSLHRGARVVDVGCGAGLLLRSLHELGFRALTGIEPYLRHEVALPDGVRIERGTLSDVNGEWDLIMFHHSFEHVPNPAGVLADAASRMTGGACILIRVPVVPSFSFDRYGEDWVGWDAPRHLFIPSVRGMERLAAAAGLRVTLVRYDSTELQFWGSEQYRRDIPLFAERSVAVNPRGSEFTREELRTFRRRANELNNMREGDQAAFYLVRSTAASGRVTGGTA